MEETLRIGDLDRGPDARQERATWRRQRVAWLAIALILIAALLGLLGGAGALSAATVATPDQALAVDYDRFTHFGAPTELNVHVRRGEGSTNVAVASAYLEGYSVDGVVPQPESVSAAGERVVYTFDLNAPAIVRFSLTPREVGLQRATVFADDADAVRFHQVVYP